MNNHLQRFCRDGPRQSNAQKAGGADQALVERFPTRNRINDNPRTNHSSIEADEDTPETEELEAYMENLEMDY